MSTETSSEDDHIDDESDNELLMPPKPRELRDVYVLGAGFSRALCPAMPLVSGLSQVVAGYGESYGAPLQTSGLDSTIGKLILRNFEEALSYLAEQKPWLDESENQKDKVRLLELTRNIRWAIGRCQQGARDMIEAGQCDWIEPLFLHWHSRRAVVITLNYDTLVEEIVERIGGRDYPGLPIEGKPTAFYLDSRSFLRVANIHPPYLRDLWLGSTDAVFADSRFNQPSFRLLKLHGSVNWLKSPNTSAQSDTISYFPGNEVAIDSAGTLPAKIADKVPFIVPPVPNKGSLVHHDSLRAIWHEAAEAIKWARRIFVLGYSLPTNDTLLIQMIRGNLFNNRPAIELVNPDPKLLRRVKATFDGEGINVVRRFGGANCVKRFVARKAFLS